MSTKHFVDKAGKYIGGFGDGALPPTTAIEVFTAPNHGTDKWKGNKWEEDTVEKTKKEKRALIEAEEAAFADALLDLLPAAYADRVAAYRAAKL